MPELDEGSGLLATLEARDPENLAPEPQEPVAEVAPEPEPQRTAADYEREIQGLRVEHERQLNGLKGEASNQRDRRRKLETELAELRGRFDEFSRVRAEPAKPAEPVDDLKPPPEELYNQNAAEYLKQAAEYNAKIAQREIDRINGEINTYKAQETEAATRRQQAEQVHQLDTAYARASNAYWGQAPEAREAYNAFAGTRMKQLARLGYAPDRAAAVLANEERSIAYQALTSERNPAQVIHEMMLDAGWQPTKAAEPAPVDPQPSRDERRRTASTSLSQASGAAAQAPGLGDVAGMSNEEFAAWRKKGGRVEDMIGKQVA